MHTREEIPAAHTPHPPGVADGAQAGPMLAEFLAERDAPCPGCGYNLRGLTRASCPECKQPLVLSVTLEHPVSKAWLAAILPPWIVGGGFACLEVLVSIKNPPFQRSYRGGFLPWTTEGTWIYIYPTLATVVLVGLAIGLTRAKGQRWFNRSHRRVSVAWASASFSFLMLAVWVVWLFAHK